MTLKLKNLLMTHLLIEIEVATLVSQIRLANIA